jgi:hypothetical protein
MENSENGGLTDVSVRNQLLSGTIDSKHCNFPEQYPFNQFAH